MIELKLWFIWTPSEAKKYFIKNLFFHFVEGEVYSKNHHVNMFWAFQQVEELFCVWNVSVLTLARVQLYACLKERKIPSAAIEAGDKNGLLSNGNHFFLLILTQTHFFFKKIVCLFKIYYQT